jgi:uncharacterized protein
MKAFSGGVIERSSPALRYVFSEPDIVPIPGCESVAKAQENWSVFTGDRTLTEQDRTHAETTKQKFDQAFCRRCDYCQPCTEGIAIQMVLGLNSFLKRLGRQTLEAGWVKDLIEKGRNCSECGACLPRCPYQLPIPDLIKENLALWDQLQKEG